MRITKVETLDLRWPFDRVRSDAVNLTDAWGFATVRLHTDEGLIGTGYTGTARGLGNDLILLAVQRYYAPELLGADASEIGDLWRRLYWCPLHWSGRAGVSQMALSAVDIALWDLAAQAAGQPLWRYLGGEGGQPLPAYNTDGGWLSFDTEELAANALETVENGFAGVKIKLGKPDTAEDLRRLGLVRDAIGADASLMVDVNQGWTLDHALQWAPKLSEFGVKWLEEPLVDPDSWRAHAALSAAITTPVALGEHVYSHSAFEDFVEARAVGYVQVDATRVGGITEFLRVAALAAEYSLPVCPHAGDMMQVHQHVVFAAPTAHLFEHIPWGADLFNEPARVMQGKLHPPEAPGAGTAMRAEAIERYLVSPPEIINVEGLVA